MNDVNESSSRGLIRSMLIIGSAQGISIFISIIKMKGIAVLLGPSGLGLLSIFNSFLTVGQKASGLGMKMSGVREIASAKGNSTTLSRVRRVLFAAHLIQGLLAMLAVWVLREQISVWLFGEETYSYEVGIIGLVILIALLSQAQVALLQGLRRIKDLGRVTVLGAFVGTLFGLLAVYFQGENGLIWFVFVQPLAAVIVAFNSTRKLPKPSPSDLKASEIWNIWRSMAKIGITIMAGGLLTTATVLVVRSYISQELGLSAAGHFAAAWGITMTYLGPMLAAMGADYYPRLTEVIHKKTVAAKLMNDQTQLGLAIGGPLLLLVIGFAPWLISLLYSNEFLPAVALLQWQILGNVFKIAGWSLGFAHVAAGRANIFFLLDITFNIIFLIIIWFLLSSIGIVAAGLAFTFAYAFSLVLNFLLVRKFYNFSWEPLSKKLLLLHTFLSIVLLVLAFNYPILAALLSLLIGSLTGVFGLRIVLSKIGQNGSIPKKMYYIFKRVNWPIKNDV